MSAVLQVIVIAGLFGLPALAWWMGREYGRSEVEQASEDVVNHVMRAIARGEVPQADPAPMSEYEVARAMSRPCFVEELDDYWPKGRAA